MIKKVMEGGGGEGCAEERRGAREGRKERGKRAKTEGGGGWNASRKEGEWYPRPFKVLSLKLRTAAALLN